MEDICEMLHKQYNLQPGGMSQKYGTRVMVWLSIQSEVTRGRIGSHWILWVDSDGNAVLEELHGSRFYVSERQASDSYICVDKNTSYRAFMEKDGDRLKLEFTNYHPSEPDIHYQHLFLRDQLFRWRRMQ